MIICEHCGMEFQTQWHLQRHTNKKKPCASTDKSYSIICNKSIQCKFCNEIFKRKYNRDKHEVSCKENNRIRHLEMKLGIECKHMNVNSCRFCNKVFNRSDNLGRHLKICKTKHEYEKELESKLMQNLEKHHVTINNNYNTVFNIMHTTINKFGEETTDHITNSFLRKTIGRIGTPLSKAVSTVAKRIYCEDTKPENNTLKITNIRSQWAKVSNGFQFELMTMSESVDNVRNKVTDLYIERQEEMPDYFEPVSKQIEVLDDLNNQNYIASSLIEKEQQKEATKLKIEIERELKSSIYNIQRLGT